MRRQVARRQGDHDGIVPGQHQVNDDDGQQRRQELHREQIGKPLHELSSGTNE
ncbi:hypothetical protein D3C86_2043410 [compost metagenome]